VEAATLLVAASDDPIPIVATSRMKTDDGTTLAAENGAPVITTCGCLDVDLSLDDADQRFVHDLQAESGSAPGIFGVEAYDAGRLLVRLIDRAGGDRASLAAGLARTGSWDGLGGTYRLEPDGSWSQGTIPAAWWRAVGSRWLPEPVSKP
jgi:ABC-type branched-subunit amino acid transport system substrate-binding protein